MWKGTGERQKRRVLPYLPDGNSIKLLPPSNWIRWPHDHKQLRIDRCDCKTSLIVALTYQRSKRVLPLKSIFFLHLFSTIPRFWSFVSPYNERLLGLLTFHDTSISRVSGGRFARNLPLIELPAITIPDFIFRAKDRSDDSCLVEHHRNEWRLPLPKYLDECDQWEQQQWQWYRRSNDIKR